MSPLHSRDTDPYQGAVQNLSPISLPKPAWQLQLIGLGVVIVGSAANIKSHKPDGEVELRNIHARSMNEREGLSTWVSRELQGPLTVHTWFLTSSAQLVADIKTVAAEDSDYSVKLKRTGLLYDWNSFRTQRFHQSSFPSWSQVQVVVRSC